MVAETIFRPPPRTPYPQGRRGSMGRKIDTEEGILQYKKTDSVLDSYEEHEF